MASPGRIHGLVVSESGSPIAGASILIESGTAPTPDIGILSGDDGAFVLALPPGKFQLLARLLDGRSGRATVDTTRDERVVIVITRPP